MTLLSSDARKLVLTTHVVASVGWLGAAGAFLVLALVGLRTADLTLARAMYLAMEQVGWYAIVPLCAASLVSGVVQGLGTAWGLVRHWWVAIKLAMTLFATLLLLVHMQPVGALARVAEAGPVAGAAARNVQTQLVVDAAAATLLLLVATALSVYKPRGVTAFGRAR